MMPSVGLMLLFVAPVPAGPTPSWADLKATVGTRYNAKELRRVGAQLPHHPRLEIDAWERFAKWPAKDDGRPSDSFDLRWPEDGLRMVVCGEKVDSITMYNRTAVPGDYGCYPGELPLGLTFDDDEVVVVRKRGRPKQRSEIGPQEVDPKRSVELVQEVSLLFPQHALSVILWIPPVGRGAPRINAVEYGPYLAALFGDK